MGQNAQNMKSGITLMISGDLSPLTASLNEARAQVADTSWVDQVAGNVMNVMQSYAVVAGIASAAVVAPVYLAVGALTQYNDAMTKTIAVGGQKFADNYDAIATKVSEVGTKFGISAADTTSALFTMVKSGWDYKDLMDNRMADTVTMFARANGVSVDLAAQSMNAILHIFQAGNKDASKYAVEYANLMQYVVQNTALEAGQLPGILEYSGSAAAMANIPVKELLAAAGALSQIDTVMGEAGGTTLTRIFMDQGSKINGLLGAQIRDSKTGAIDMNALMTALGSADESKMQALFAGYNDSVRFGQMMQRMKTVSGEYNKLMVGMGTMTDTYLEDVATGMATSWSAVITRVKEAINAPLMKKEVQQAISTVLNNVLALVSRQDVTDQIRDIVLASSEFVTKALPGVLSVVKQLLTLFRESMPYLNNLFGGLLNVLGILTKIPAQLLIGLAMMKVVGNGLGKLRDSFGFILAAPKQIMGTYNMMPWRLSKSSAIAATARLNQQGLADNVSVEKMNQIQRGINARNAYLSMQAAKVGPTDASFIPGYVPASYVKSSEVTKVADLTTAPKMSAPGQPVISKEYSITSPFMPDPRTVFELEKVALVTAKVGDNAEVAVKKASLFQRAFGKNTMSMEKFGNACSMTQGMLSGIATGIIMMATSTDPWIKGIGAMVVALSTFAAVLTFVRTLLDPKSWFGGPIGAIALATLATAATVGAVYAMTSAPSGNGLNTQAYEKAPSGTVFASATATDAAASSNSTVVYNQWFPTAVQSPLTVAANR